MGVFEDIANAAASVASAVGDGVEAVVDTVVETTEAGADFVEDALDGATGGARDWADENLPEPVDAVANVIFGLWDAGRSVVFDGLGVGRRLVASGGHLIADLLRLDVAGAVDEVGTLAITLGEAWQVGFRWVTGGYVWGAIEENFERSDAFDFIKALILDELGEVRGRRIIDRLGFGTPIVGLRIPVDYFVLRMDSASYPTMAADHRAGAFNLFALAGLPSFNSFKLARNRTRVVIVDGEGRDQWLLPVGRSVIQSFLDTGSPRLRVYAWDNHAASRAMRFARKKFRRLAISLDFGSAEWLARYQGARAIDIVNLTEFRIDVNADEDHADFFRAHTPSDGSAASERRISVIGCFEFTPSGFHGVAVSTELRRGEGNDFNCVADDPSVRCTSRVVRALSDRRAAGRGVMHRDSYPPFFSKMVLAHEIGHHFGLVHPGHDGIDNIMFSLPSVTDPRTGDPDWSRVVGLRQLARLWSKGEPDFSPTDLEHAWRFIVRQLGGVLDAQ